MRAILLVCAVALLGLSCTQYASVIQPLGQLDIAVAVTPDGVLIKNIGSVDCLVFVNSPEGEQRFELAAGQNITVTDVSQPVEVSAVAL